MSTDPNCIEPGWWVPADDWFKQRLWPLTGCWQQIRCADGRQLQACMLSGREGWWNQNYEPVPNVVEWFRPAAWFDGPDDIHGNVAKWKGYVAAAFANRSPLRGLVAAGGGLPKLLPESEGRIASASPFAEALSLESE